MTNARYSVYGTAFFCVCVLFIRNVRASDDFKDRCFYISDKEHGKSDHLIDIEVLPENDLHKHWKRDVEDLPVSSKVFLPNNLSEKVIPLRGYNESTSNPDNGTLKQLHYPGVNGTGQRKQKIMPVMIRGALIHPPIPNSQETDYGNEDGQPNKRTLDEEAFEDDIDQKDLENNNITSVKQDTHVFYNSSIYNSSTIGQSFWVDMEQHSDVKVNELLSNSHRRAATVKLSFEFPFYGRYIKNVTVATGGFLYTGNYVHSWLAATQYIAPLMANFDTGLSNTSFVKYVDNGTAFTVEWEKVTLQDKPKYEFTFQASLYKNGDIVFVYKSVPLPISDINEQRHPVKVGLSDAYILERTVYYVRRNTIYEYHRVSFSKEEIKNWTVIYLKALPTCLDQLNCTSCLRNDLNLNCTWCPSLRQCSTGLDRNRQFWLEKGCDRTNITIAPICEIYGEDVEANDGLNYDVDSKGPVINYIGQVGVRREREFGTSGYVAVIFLIIMVAGVAFWMAYAYKNPHTTSGQILIRYRPSQWRWRRGEARYTAATIHM